MTKLSIETIKMEKVYVSGEGKAKLIGEWNSVMFDIEGEFPFSFHDSYIWTPPKLVHSPLR